MSSSWFADTQRMLDQMRSAMFPLEQIQKLTRISVPGVELHQQMQKSFAAIAEQAMPSKAIEEMLASMSRIAQLPKVTLPPEFFQSVRFQTDQISPVLKQLHDLSVAHQSLGERLGAQAAGLLAEGYAGLGDVVEEPAEGWTGDTLKRTIESASRYQEVLVLLVWLALTGMIVSTRQTRPDPEVMLLLEQIRDVGQFITLVVVLMKWSPDGDDD